MKYRTKLYLAVVGVSLASILAALLILAIEAETLVFRILQSRSLSIAATAASQLDPELLKKASFASSFEDPAYIQLQKQLRIIAMANRRSDIFVSNLYILYPSSQDPTTLLFGVETNYDPIKPGSTYLDSDTQLILKNWGKYFTDHQFISNQHGTWLSGFAPIFDEKGDPIAALGVDINAADIHLRLKQLVYYALIGLAISLCFCAVIAFFLSKKVTRCLDHLCQVVRKIESGNLDAKACLKTNDEFGKLANQINSMTLGLKERDRLKASFARYVSTHILDKILLSETPLKLEGEKKKVTLLFSDIRQFTQLAENLPAEKVVHLLNEYFEAMIEVIFAQSGTLDKFIGDGIMAEFGAPLDDDNQEEHAVRAAIEMQCALAKLCKKWRAEGKPCIQMGIGIHTGEAVVGNIGSEQRTEYTAIGDTVNVAARLEQATKTFDTPILVSESTYMGSKDLFSYKDLGAMAIPGRKEQVKVFAVNSLATKDP